MADRRRVALAALLACAPAGAAPRGAGLADAIRANDVAAVGVALAAHADPNARLAFGATPLMIAVNTQNPEMVARLLAARSRPDMADADGVTPLSLACELGDPKIAAALIDAGADVRAPAADGVTPLAMCAGHGPAAAVARMIAAGAPVDPVDARGQTPLMWAAAAGATEAMALLLKAGADANRVSNGGFTPLFFAIAGGGRQATALLLDAGARTDHRGPEGTSAVQLAMYQKNWRAAAMLVERGDADVRATDRHGHTLLHAAAAGGDAALVRLLVARGADPNALTTPSRVTWVTEANFGVPPPPVPPTPPLLLAAAGGHADAMRALIDGGANAGFVAADGVNVLLAAARGSSVAALALAVQVAPQVDVVDAQGRTPLHLLLGGGNQPDLAPMMRLLAVHGARTDIASKRGRTAAMAAAGGLAEVRTIYDATFPSAPATLTAAR